jgi:hypothetical protein
MSNATEVKQELAKEALQLQAEVDELTSRLDAKKEELRELANGKKLNIVVGGVGKIDITEPRSGGTKVVFNFNEDKISEIMRKKLLEAEIAKEVLVINEEKLGKAPALKDKLVEKGVVREEIKKVSAAKASVRIKLNV